jgi:hypothetical protein
LDVSSLGASSSFEDSNPNSSAYHRFKRRSMGQAMYTPADQFQASIERRSDADLTAELNRLSPPVELYG